MTSSPVGIAHLTLLHLTPPELVSAAATAGYDFVGVRVQAVTAGEHQYPMRPGSPMSRETLQRLHDTGLTVRDVEFLTLGEHTSRSDWLPALEAGAALGARTISVVGVDPDRARLTDTLSRLTADGHEFGITPTLEPISYQPVSRIGDAAELATAAGAAVLIDALHLQRGGDSVAQVRALDPALVPCAQLCDGPLATPDQLDVPAQLPLGMTTNGSPRQLEARALRQLPGDGELPLVQLVEALPPGTPISVEVPNATLQQATSAEDFARRNLAAVRRVLEQTHKEKAPSDV